MLVKEDEVLPLRCSSAVAAECATTASCASSGGGSSVGTDLNGGELCTLCAEEGREGTGKESECEGG